MSTGWWWHNVVWFVGGGRQAACGGLVLPRLSQIAGETHSVGTRKTQGNNTGLDTSSRGTQLLEGHKFSGDTSSRGTQVLGGHKFSGAKLAGDCPRNECLFMILLIDNYDSFTYNLVQRLGEIDPKLDLRVVRNDQISLEQIAQWSPSHLMISPGPCTPNEAGISVEAIARFGPEIPTLGVCLGHQSIGQAFGATISRADRLMHGKTDLIHHDRKGIFSGLPNPFQATRYHSLIIQAGTLSPTEFELSAWSTTPQGQQEIMGIRHRRYPIVGVQFHPESFLTEDGTTLLRNFLAMKRSPDLVGA